MDYQTGILVDKKIYIISSNYLSTEASLYLSIINFEKDKSLYVKSNQNNIKISTNYFTLQNLEFVLFDNKSPAAIYMSSSYNDMSEDSFKTKIGYINNLELNINDSPSINEIKTNYYNNYIEISIYFNDIITNMKIDLIQLINNNNSSKIINLSSFNIINNYYYIKVQISYLSLSEEYFLKFIYDNYNYYEELLILNPKCK